MSELIESRREIIPAGEEAKLLADTIMPGASEVELRFFAEVCNRMGLDPFRREIHAVKRRVNEDGRWIERWVYQTGIDGYRKRAAGTGVYAGSEVITEPVDAPIPAIARATVYRLVGGQRVPFTAVARWAEYVQTTRDGKPAAMWAKMPHTMLEKVAEAKALRRAFPDELNGIYAEEEMHQASNPPAALEVSDKTNGNPFAKRLPAPEAPALAVEPPKPSIHDEVAAKCAKSGFSPEAMEAAMCVLAGEDITWTNWTEGQLRGLLKPERWAKVEAAVAELNWQGDAA